MATIRKRGNRWHVQVRRNGAPAASHSFSTKADAQAWARKTEAEIDRGDLPVRRSAISGYTVADLLNRYAEEVTPRKKSAHVEVYRLKRMTRSMIGRSPLTGLTPQLVAAYRDDRLKEVGPQAVRHDLNVLSHVVETAKREWGISVGNNPVAEVWKPRQPRGRSRRVADREIALLEASATGHERDHLMPLVRLALHTGMRRGELLALRYQDVDLQARTAFVAHSKNGHPRTVPLSEPAVAELRGLMEERRRHVFQQSTNAVRLAWSRLSKRAGLDDLHFHDLRHEAISRFFEMGLSMPEVALISGHSDYRMLARYTHMQAQHIAERLAS